MKKLSVLLLALFMFTPITYGQFLDRFEALNEVNIKGYAQPFGTTFGLAMNSGGFYTADIPSVFGFSFGIKGMYILIPDDNKFFTPTLSPGYNPTEVATIYGDKGGAFAGPGGYQTTPPGLNVTGVPLAYPQVTFSFMGTELLVRYLPDIKISNEDKLNMLGLGVRHSISQYFPLFPVDMAVQVLYNKFEITNLLTSTNLAFNVHASKTFAIVTPYIGLQYESSSLDLDYTYKPEFGSTALEQRIQVTLDGDNSFRGIIGTSFNLVFLVLNFDVGLSTQTVLTGGLTFAF
jgi:hypothetical protein